MTKLLFDFDVQTDNTFIYVYNYFLAFSALMTLWICISGHSVGVTNFQPE